MKNHLARLLFTILFSLFATATASAMLYILPVLAYIGYQTQIPEILIGYSIGALVFSSIGTVIALYSDRPVIYGFIASIFLALVLSVAYRMTGVTANSDLIIGSLASQSFAIFYSTLFQNFRSEKRKWAAAGTSVVIFTLLNIVIFLAIALIYLDLGQAYLPNIVAYLEIMCAVIGLLVLVLFFMSGKRPQAS